MCRIGTVQNLNADISTDKIPVEKFYRKDKKTYIDKCTNIYKYHNNF